jgi:hypothetical protein
MRQRFILAAILACVVTDAIDPQTRHKMWLVTCQSPDQHVVLPARPRTLKGAIKLAHKWLDPKAPKQFTVSLQALHKPGGP